MFEADSEWDDGKCSKNLSEALFGEIKAGTDKFQDVNNKLIAKSKPIDDKSGEQPKGDDSSTRKKWKMKQKNKRKAKNKYKEQQEKSVKMEVIHETCERSTKSCNLETTPESKKKIMRKRQNLMNISSAQLVEDSSTNSQEDTETFVKKRKLNNRSDQKTSYVTKPTLKKNEDGFLSPHQSPSLKDQLTNKLNSSRFRYINEQMYSSPSQNTKKLFEKDPTAFSIYHQGFLSQVEKWPSNPLNHIISWLRSRSPKLVVADLGCGEAFLAQSIRNKVYSFDLVAINEHVTVADITEVPLDASTVDVVVCCLSLMSTNFAECLVEANRILKPKGILKIAEVASRFRGAGRFISELKKLGFELIKKDLTNSHFYAFDFRKSKNVGKSAIESKDLTLELRPCVYKKR